MQVSVETDFNEAFEGKPGDLKVHTRKLSE